MSEIKKILVPTDFSAHADEAFRVAHTLARALGAEVVLFHVARPPAVVSEGGRFLTDPAGGKPVNLWDRFHALREADPGVRVGHEVIVATRPGARHVLDILDKLGCDMIVMGTHGASSLGHLLFGSLTEDVVRFASCPVLVVKAPARERPAAAPQAGKAHGASGPREGT
jgi:nucleotide-binding universal stress UspA family protein